MSWLGFLFSQNVCGRIFPSRTRAITLDEHRAIVAREQNSERRAFYQLAWHMGASQSDLACLEAESVDWESKVISSARKKTGELAFVSFGKEVEEILRDLPSTGPLFPYLRSVRAGDRATEFRQRCRGLGIQGVTMRCSVHCHHHRVFQFFNWVEAKTIISNELKFERAEVLHFSQSSRVFPRFLHNCCSAAFTTFAEHKSQKPHFNPELRKMVT
jgi:hypothetical protein